MGNCIQKTPDKKDGKDKGRKESIKESVTFHFLIQHIIK